jgi:alanine racemase
MGLRHTQVYPINLKLDGTPPHASLKIKVIIRGRRMEVEGWICMYVDVIMICIYDDKLIGLNSIILLRVPCLWHTSSQN